MSKKTSKMSKNVEELREQITQLFDREALESNGVPTSEINDYLKYVVVPVELIVRADWNYKEADSGKAERLANMLKTRGQIKNLNLRELDTGYFECVDGNHRYDDFLATGRKTAVAVNHGKVSRAEAIRMSIELETSGFKFDDELFAERMEELTEEFDFSELGMTIDMDDVEMEFSNAESETRDEDTLYTRKVETPVYEPTGEKPAINELFDSSKTDGLISEINESKLPEDLKRFLISAAYRHTKFNYSNIAEFYAHLDAEIQKLFEDSALVIIDYDKAIERGFVKLVGRLLEQQGQN